MARKTKTVVVSAEGRDQGKVFLLTEMPATRAEEWGIRLLLAMTKNGIDVPDDMASAGLAGVAAMGIKALGGVPFSDAKPLMAEMFACIQRVMSDPGRPEIVRGLVEDDIEEIATRLMLRKEVFGLHVDFSRLVGNWTSASSAGSQGDSPST
jgi:hypothetical protein